MTKIRPGDDFVFYFAWKSDVEKNDLAEAMDRREPSARKLSRKLSLSPSLVNDPTLEDKKLKFKSNREIELINKWKAVDKADDDLQNVRDAHLRRLQSYQSRWTELEEGQLQLKQNLVKFNNFVKEKLMKVEEGEVRSQKQSEVFRLKHQEALGLDEQLKVLRRGRDQLRLAVEEKENYSRFLQSVLAERSELFDNIHVMMSRCESLIMSRDNLQARHIL